MIVKQTIKLLNCSHRSLAIYMKGSGNPIDSHEYISFAILDKDGNEIYRQGDIDAREDKIEPHTMTI